MLAHGQQQLFPILRHTTHTPPYTVYEQDSKMGDSLVHQEYGRTRVQWLASLNTEYNPPNQFRRTSIICTIGRHSND